MSDLLDELLDDSQTNYLKKSCPSLFDGSGAPKFSYNNILSTDENIIIPDGLKYYQMVETGNNYVNDLLSEEEKYLKEKYGESLYNYFVNERKHYINNRINEMCSKKISPSSLGFGDDGDGGNGDSEHLYIAMTKQLNSYKQTLITYNEVSKKQEKKKESNFLDSRKFHYRSNAMEDVDKIDTYISIFYYFVLVISLMYIGKNGHLNVGQNWWVYLLLFVLPMILSNIYIFLVKRFQGLKEILSENGPKNAFLNEV